MIRKLITYLFVGLWSVTLHAEFSMVDKGKEISLINDEVSMTIEKESARVTVLKHKGKSLLAPGQSGYFAFKAGQNGGKIEIQRVEDCEYRIHLETEDTIDMSFVPKRVPEFPFDLEIHYVIRKGDPGYYFYLVASKPPNSPDAQLNQLRYAIRLDYSMLNVRLNDERNGMLPSTESLENSIGDVMDATFMTPNGEIVTKYSWSSPTGEAPVYGLNNGKQGVWFIRGGSDYLCGGPTKQHNTCHATDRGPIILGHFYSNHYGSDGSYVSNGSSRWEKVYGPTFIYLNQANGEDALWEDAKRQCEIQERQWPYQWVDQSEYPIDRATVSGRFANATNGWAILARPKEYRGLDWQHQGADSYIARALILHDGSFKIPAVRKGNYSLYAISSGIVGEYRLDNVVVDSAGELQLGNLHWKVRSRGELLWRIGTPNRRASEFRHGDDFRHWGLWYHYARDFPNDVDFVIGESNERTDWNYAQMAVFDEKGGWKPKLDKEPVDGEWKLPVWKVRFDGIDNLSGKATLTIAVAGVSRPGKLQISLNGKSIGKVEFPHGDSSIHRSGIAGTFEERFISFDASRIRSGENVISLQLIAKIPKTHLNYSPFGLMYDFLQLEVDRSD